MSDESYEAGARGPAEGDPDEPRGRSTLMSVLPWVAGSVIVLALAVGAGLATAYLVATFRAAPPPEGALVTPPPIPSPTPTPSPSPIDGPSPSPTSTPEPTPEQSPEPEATPLVHVVARGESLSLIAGQYGTTTDAIIELNQLQNPNLIVPGQRLLIPQPANGP